MLLTEILVVLFYLFCKSANKLSLIFDDCCCFIVFLRLYCLHTYNISNEALPNIITYFAMIANCMWDGAYKITLAVNRKE